jgi:uncharacterized membrane protein YoaK (UPF0700 family)
MAGHMTGFTSHAAVLAHQGGWDEWLLVVVPIVVIIALLAIVKRRVSRLPPPD